MRSNWTLLAAVTMFGVLLCAGGCDQSPPQQPLVNVPPTSQPEDRIVSLAPTLTQMLKDLRGTQGLVGVGLDDAAAPPGLPVVGTNIQPDLEMLAKLHPTLVMTLAGKDGTPPQLVAAARTISFHLLSYPYPATIADLGNILLNEEELIPNPQAPPQCLGMVMDLPKQALLLKQEMIARLSVLRDATDEKRKPSVLLVIDTNPLMASGPGTIHHQLLSFAGGLNAAFEAKVSAPTYDREALLALAPDVILFLLPGQPPLGAIDKDARLAMFRGLDIPAVKSSRLFLISDPMIQVPSTALPRLVALLAKAIHPDVADKIDSIMAESQDEILRFRNSPPVPATAPATATAPAEAPR